MRSLARANQHRADPWLSITASRAARSPVAQPPLQADPHEVYHSLCPLPALSPVPKASDPSSLVAQAENEAAYRQLLVRGVLAVLLPTEDLENECLTALVGQIFSELIIGNIIANRLSEPWLIWEGLIIASRVMQQRRDPATTPRRPASGGQGETGKEGKRGFSVHGLFWTFLQWCFLLTGFVRTLVTTLAISRSLPSRVGPARGGRVGQDKEGSDRKRPVEPTEPVLPLETHPQVTAAKVPVIAFRCWSALSNLVELNARMPWACGTLSMLQWFALAGPGRIAAVDGIIDRYASRLLSLYTPPSRHISTVTPQKPRVTGSLHAPFSVRNRHVLDFLRLVHAAGHRTVDLPPSVPLRHRLPSEVGLFGRGNEI